MLQSRFDMNASGWFPGAFFISAHCLNQSASRRQALVGDHAWFLRNSRYSSCSFSISHCQSSSLTIFADTVTLITRSPALQSVISAHRGHHEIRCRLSLSSQIISCTAPSLSRRTQDTFRTGIKFLPLIFSGQGSVPHRSRSLDKCQVDASENGIGEFAC